MKKSEEPVTRRKKQWLEGGRVDLLHQAMVEFVAHYGENNVGMFGISMPESANITLDYAVLYFLGYKTLCLRKRFKSGIWTLERQKVTLDWHPHALVAVEFDIKTGFSWEALQHKLYARIPMRTRKLWKQLREDAERKGYIEPETVGAELPLEDVKRMFGAKTRGVHFNRPHLTPLRDVQRAISYLSGVPLWGKKDHKPPPECCGSWEEGKMPWEK